MRCVPQACTPHHNFPAKPPSAPTQLQAPEILAGGSATAASDVYSFSMVGSASWQLVLHVALQGVTASEGSPLPSSRAAAIKQPCPVLCASPMPQVLFELLTWRLPWTFTDMTPFKARAACCMRRTWLVHAVLHAFNRS